MSAPTVVARSRATVSVGTVVLAALAGGFAWYGSFSLHLSGIGLAISTQRRELVGPVVLVFVAGVFLLEQLTPAVRRPIRSRGQLLDLLYLLLYAVAVVPLVVLMGVGAATALAHAAPWLVLPRLPGVPRVGVLLVALVAFDGANFVGHALSHRLPALWGVHAAHHSQEDLSILTSFRAHPLAHVGYLVSAVPALIFAADASMPAVLLSAYACLGALPHANLNWSYGRLGRVLVSPAYHRLHHGTGGADVPNLGVVFTCWDRLTKRAVFPDARASVPVTGLTGRPVPVEQEDGVRLTSVLARQLLGPFVHPSRAAGLRSCD